MNSQGRKTIIKQAFSKAAHTYAEASGLQKEVARELASKLKEAPGRTLDIGAGTGYLAEAIKEKFPDTELFVCDLSHEMLRAAKDAADGKDYRAFTADCEELPVKDSSFDLVVSSLTYQWSADITSSMLEAERVLAPGGSFIFSTLGAETMRELRKATRATYRISGRTDLPRFMEFLSAEDIGDTLIAVGFEDINIERELKEVSYKDLRELLRTLKKIGATNPESPESGNLSSGSLLRKVAETYARLAPAPDNSGITATYEILSISASRA